MTEHELIVGSESAGERLDLYLAAELGVSRGEVRRLLARGGVRSGGRPLGTSDKGRALHQGMRLSVAGFRPAEDQRILPEPGGPRLEILSEGPGWCAVDKPARVPVHPLREDETGTVLNDVVCRWPELQGVGEGGLRSGVVHRLDVDTSGALLVATEESSWQRLRRAFAEHRVEKVYTALVSGTVDAAREVEVGLVVAQHRPARVKVVVGSERETDGVRATSLTLRPVEQLEGATLLEVRPRTGFLHQIRATLAHLGHPVLGDAGYGGECGGADRHMLHAASVAFEEVNAACAPPADFLALLEALRAS